MFPKFLGGYSRVKLVERQVLVTFCAQPNAVRSFIFCPISLQSEKQKDPLRQLCQSFLVAEVRQAMSARDELFRCFAGDKRKITRAGGVTWEGLQDDFYRLNLVRGLSNEAGHNNCFLNVVIQSLWHLRSFRQAFLRLNPQVLAAPDISRFITMLHRLNMLAFTSFWLIARPTSISRPQKS